MSVSAIVKLIFCILCVGPYIKTGWVASTLTLKVCYNIKLNWEFQMSDLMIQVA